MTIFRNPDGFSTHGENEWAANLDRLTPLKYVTGFWDWVAETSSLPAGWTHTNTNGTLAMAGLVGGSGSLLTQTLGGADNDLSQIYATTATVNLTAGKKAFFRWRGKVDKGAAGTIGEQELYVGLSAVQTGTNFVAAAGDVLAVDDFIGFASFDGTVNINANVRKSDVESTEAAVTSYADATYMSLAWDFDGSTVTFYKDTTKLTQLSAFPTAALAPMIYFKGGEAKPAVLTTDYLFFAIERSV